MARLDSLCIFKHCVVSFLFVVCTCTSLHCCITTPCVLWMSVLMTLVVAEQSVYTTASRTPSVWMRLGIGSGIGALIYLVVTTATALKICKN